MFPKNSGFDPRLLGVEVPPPGDFPNPKYRTLEEQRRLAEQADVVDTITIPRKDFEDIVHTFETLLDNLDGYPTSEWDDLYLRLTSYFKG